eukprot:GGOE01017765.1.p1 GENE.GGOE01017765.1~~GGOE01017765.1.p1  ORF type:complete len:1000 (-),score=244.77 GGOE01017765.1:217-3216(-)
MNESPPKTARTTLSLHLNDLRKGLDQRAQTIRQAVLAPGSIHRTKAEVPTAPVQSKGTPRPKEVSKDSVDPSAPINSGRGTLPQRVTVRAADKAQLPDRQTSTKGFARQQTTYGVGDLEGLPSDGDVVGRTRPHWHKNDAVLTDMSPQRQPKAVKKFTSNRDMYMSQCAAAGVFPIPEVVSLMSEENLRFDLRELRLPGRRISTLVPFLAIVRANQSLRTIDFSNNPFGTEDVLLLLDALSDHPKCRDLYLVDCSAVKWNANALRQLHRLESKRRELNVHLHPPERSYFDIAAESSLDPMQSVPAMDENIILVVDQDPQMAKLVGDTKIIDLVKQGLHLFVHTKKEINHNHGFCLCGLTHTAKDFAPFELSFEPSVLSLAPKIDSLGDGMDTKAERPATDDEGPDFTSVLTILEAKMEECRSADPKRPAIFRMIFIYGRTRRLPRLIDNGTARRVLGSPNLFLDVVFLHEEITEEHHAAMQNVFHRLVAIASKCQGSAYVLDCCLQPPKAQRVFNAALTSLLCHPLQRPFNQTKFISKLGQAGERPHVDARRVHKYLQLRYPPSSSVGMTLSSMADEWQELSETEVLFGPRDPMLYRTPLKREIKQRLRRRVNVVANNIPEAFACTLCGDLASHPVLGSHCEHTFCQLCLSGATGTCPSCHQKLDPSRALEPNDEFRDVFSKVHFLCPYGCGECLQEAERTTHFQTCTLVLVDCASPLCGWVGPRQAYAEHWFSCRHRSVRCAGCNATVPMATVQDHLVQCHRCCFQCQMEVSPAYMPWHLAHECPRSMAQCTYADLGCGFRTTADNEKALETHLLDDCLIHRAITAITRCSEELKAISTSAKDQSTFLQNAIESLGRSISMEVAHRCLQEHHALFALRRRLMEALIGLFGCPLEYGRDYTFIAFAFNCDVAPPSPFVAICRLSGEFPAKRPKVVLMSFVQTFIEADLLCPVSIDIDLEYDRSWDAETVAYAIRSHILTQSLRLDRMTRDREAALRGRS